MTRRRHEIVLAGTALAALAAAGVGCSRSTSAASNARDVAPRSSSAAASADGLVPRPRTVSWLIPFPASRRRETAAYAARHYGIDSWRIRGPHVIVEHYTGSESLEGTRATFAADTPDPELGELPGTCSHFLIGKDGTIYQLVPTGVMCRHTVGLNWTAIGIEHVGRSDGEILRNGTQLRASLRLTLWLMRRFGIRLRDVIGHNESLRSPFHRERYGPWRCQTHGDWTHADMLVYRRKLRALARSLDAPALAAAGVRGPTGSTPGC